MTDDIQRSEQPGRTTEEEPVQADWQTPEYAVVDTALEVTAYSLTTR
ncbi:pyrroloquinoline quinone precursor peptide PqqA [Streptomyces sp. NPDC057740]